MRKHASCGLGARLTFACRAKNDLYRVMIAGGSRYPRYAKAADAVRAAAKNSAVLILADGYPEKATMVAAELLKTAARKKLRLYLEFPAALTGLSLERPGATTLERAVVVSDFFGPALEKRRILSVNGMRVVRVTAGLRTPAHLVAARVAGFDTAVYGLPEATIPLLFERDGNTLVAATKLSQFLTGRYAPQDAWRAVWTAILDWLCPGAAVPLPAWTPRVHSAYGCTEPLPPDAEKNALRNGVEWFFRSKLLLHPSRLGDNGRPYREGGGLFAFQQDRDRPSLPPADTLTEEQKRAFFMKCRRAPMPPPEAPAGDGTLGILEAPMSVIAWDGSQEQGVERRGDCAAESAMALAFGGAVLGEKRKLTVARNLLDFYYFASRARQYERASPEHGAYGLMAWGIDTPYRYEGNYGDDNARLLMGTLAAAALLKEDRWDKAMMQCITANLRTAGRFGFRTDCLTLADLAGGWRKFFDGEAISYSPHMECYIWACYLWAYARTGFELFYRRAETALRMTMAQYTDGWRWTNGLAQEKARILLPLAWLVRVKDTPEHRRWLNRAAEGLLALQQPCGAIREELGLPGKGLCPPPASNEEYGLREAPLIQENGDPVCDMLYTSNFAFLGLHEAAAASGDPRLAEAEANLARFLCRIQARAEMDPSLDGGWFRAFDFARWEAWGSNADSGGWGAWCIESGWTQGWIVALLGMRQMKVTLWDFASKSGIGDHFEKLRETMLPGIS